MDINLVQVLINVVGAPSARVVGSFGVRHGLQRAQRERAFERRLTWFELQYGSRFDSNTWLTQVPLQ